MAQRPIAERAAVTVLRYHTVQFADEDKMACYGATWVKANELWMSKQRFSERSDLQTFVAKLRTNRRIQVYEEENGVVWLAAKE